MPKFPKKVKAQTLPKQTCFFHRGHLSGSFGSFGSGVGCNTTLPLLLSWSWTVPSELSSSFRVWKRMLVCRGLYKLYTQDSNQCGSDGIGTVGFGVGASSILCV